MRLKRNNVVAAVAVVAVVAVAFMSKTALAVEEDQLQGSVNHAADTQENPYAGCQGVEANWIPQCPSATAVRLIFGVERKLYFLGPPVFTKGRWGNALSPYWQARALAMIAGQGFESFEGFAEGWLQHLPKQLPATNCPDPERFKQACEECHAGSWVYAHRCHGAWQQIRPTIINDTHTAVQSWLTTRKQQPPAVTPGRVVIQSRCSHDTLISHDEYGPVGFSFYSSINASTTRTIDIVAAPGEQLPACATIRAAKLKHLAARYPNSTVQLVGGSLDEDFLRLMFAPVLFKDAQSSFGLWAGLANKGQVYSVPMLPRFTHNTMPDLGNDWHWVQAPVLYPHVAAAAGIKRDDTEAIVKWLQEH